MGSRAWQLWAALLVPIALLSPFGYQGVWGRVDPRPPPALPAGARCLEPAAAMRAGHGQLLARWREAVVRRGERRARTADGTEVEMSLSVTCLGCHRDPQGFCDRCHQRLGASLDCFGCHDAARGG